MSFLERGLSKQLQVFGGALLVAAPPAMAQQVTGNSRSAKRNDNRRWQAASQSARKVWWRD